MEVLEEEEGAVGSELGTGKGEGGAGAAELPSPLCPGLPGFIPSLFLRDPWKEPLVRPRGSAGLGASLGAFTPEEWTTGG